MIQARKVQDDVHDAQNIHSSADPRIHTPRLGALLHIIETIEHFDGR